MAMYRKKPVIVEAWQFTPPALTNMPDWLGDAIYAGKAVALQAPGGLPPVVKIATMEGTMTASPGDWIIKGVKGEIYPCKPDVFAASYEPAETERLQDDEVYPCEYCRAMVANPCTDGSQAQACYTQRGGERPPDVEAMPPGARADAMQPLSPFGPGEPIPEHHYAHPNQRATRFRDEMQQVINSHSRENGSDTPDFILAEFMLEVFDAFDKAVTKRTGWYGKGSEEVVNLRTAISLLQAQVEAEGEHTAAGQAEIDRLNEVVRLLDDQLRQAHSLVLKTEAESAQLRGELQRVSMAGLTPSMVVGK